ncbi:hypothetical protein H0H87_007119 [Tephrocybe sp. NHM501043]|nr:hypothetical protein H0H87_007119 [Tephrocybe sp. NHM501043]
MAAQDVIAEDKPWHHVTPPAYGHHLPVQGALPVAAVRPSDAPQPTYGRTYDSKLVSREMHRLGNLSAAPAVPPAPSPLPAPPQSLPSTSTEPWGALHVHVLPLFNGEPLRIPMCVVCSPPSLTPTPTFRSEDLNVLVKQHIQAVVSSAPSKALSALHNGAADLIASGMVTLNAKLSGIDDDKLIPRVVEIWGFFWDQVLTYIEGVLLPLQTDPLLLSLYRPPKQHGHLRATSPPLQATIKSASASAAAAAAAASASAAPNSIDVRSVALRSFRDKVILPLSLRLYQRLAGPSRHDPYSQDPQAYQQPRLQQMLLVLTSQRRPYTHALTFAPRTPTPGEQAIDDLLRVVRAPTPDPPRPRPRAPAPTFLSGGIPRDRRGRIAHKHVPAPPATAAPRAQRVPASLILGPADPDDVFAPPGPGDVTPKGGSYAYGYRGAMGIAGDLEREREVLESLRSPDVDATAKHGGWGLGQGGEDSPGEDEEDEDDVLEREIKDYLGGMTAANPPRR